MSQAVSELLTDGPDSSDLAVILAHGAGAPIDSPFMATVATDLAANDVRVVRFEFPYMTRRRHEGTRRPPDRAPVLLQHWLDVIDGLGSPQRLVIGGKSMGGRMASLIADEANVAGLLVFGFPFHAPGKPAGERIAHLARLKTPSLIIQGTRDSMGTRDDVNGYKLSKAIEVCWIEDGDHSLKRRKKSGLSEVSALTLAVGSATSFINQLGNWSGSRSP